MPFTRNGASTAVPPPVPESDTMGAGLNALFEAAHRANRDIKEREDAAKERYEHDLSPPVYEYEETFATPAYRVEDSVHDSMRREAVEFRGKLGHLRQQMSGITTHMSAAARKHQELSEKSRLQENEMKAKYKDLKRAHPELAGVIAQHLQSVVIKDSSSIRVIIEFFHLWQAALASKGDHDVARGKIEEYDAKIAHYKSEILHITELHETNVHMFERQLKQIKSAYQAFGSTAPMATRFFDPGSASRPGSLAASRETSFTGLPNT